MRRKASVLTLLFQILNIGPRVIRFLIRCFACLIVVCFFFVVGNAMTGFIAPAAIVSGAALINVSASANKFLNLAQPIFDAGQDAADLWNSLTSTLMRCKESIVRMRNAILYAVMAFIWKFSVIINDFASGICPNDSCIVFPWANPDYIPFADCPTVLPPDRRGKGLLFDLERGLEDIAFEVEYARILPGYELEQA